MQYARSIDPSIPVIALQLVGAASTFLSAGPKSLGGRGDFSQELEGEVETANVDSRDVAKFAQQVRQIGWAS